ncbi:MAG: Ig-like domain-containing protein [Propionibacteriaceae bacterium]|nr:Ig-like domain-containing protein [Propionibacteriaceae bacterium]
MTGRLTARRRLAAFLIGCALTFLPVPEASALDKTQTQAAAGVTSAGAVSGTGNVTSKGKAVASGRIEITLDGVVVDTSSTDERGEFAFGFSMGSARPGSHTITARFLGDARHAASSIDLVIETGDALPSRISGGVDPATVVAGDVLSVSGTLTDAAGTPLADALITFALGGRAVQEATTSTDSSGSFSSIVTIPESQAPGTLSLVARYSGNATAGAASEGWDVVIGEPAPVSTATPGEQDPSPEAPSAIPTPTSLAAVPASASASPVGSAQPAAGSSGALLWIAIPTLAIAIGAGSLTAFFAYRSHAGRNGHQPGGPEDGSLLDGLGGSFLDHREPSGS